MTETFKDVQGFEGLYQISDAGRLKSLARIVKRSNGTTLRIKESIVKGSLDKKGYLRYRLHGKVDQTKKLHRLVAEAFIENPKGLPFVNHLNGVKSDNRACNLEWCTPKRNAEHAKAMGLLKVFKGPNHPRVFLSEDDVKAIRSTFLIQHKTRAAYSRHAADLAEEYGVSKALIDKIRSGKAHAWVK